MLVVVALLAGLDLPARAADGGAVLDLVARINAIRANEGLPALIPFDDRSQARTANEAYADTGTPHTTAQSAARWYFDLGGSSFGETQASGGGLSPAGAVKLWRDSPPHAQVMFDGGHTHVAVSVLTSGGSTYFTAHFARMPSGFQPAAAEPEEEAATAADDEGKDPAPPDPIESDAPSGDDTEEETAEPDAATAEPEVAAQEAEPVLDALDPDEILLVAAERVERGAAAPAGAAVPDAPELAGRIPDLHEPAPAAPDTLDGAGLAAAPHADGPGSAPPPGVVATVLLLGLAVAVPLLTKQRAR